MIGTVGQGSVSEDYKEKLVKGFTAKYHTNKLFYYELFEDINNLPGLLRPTVVGLAMTILCQSLNNYKNRT